MEALSLLQSALRNGPETLCIDLVDGAEESFIRSSNGVFLLRLPTADVAAVAQLVKQLAHLEPARHIQSGNFRLLEADFKVNCCPQPAGGEILVVHRRWDRLARLNK